MSRAYCHSIKNLYLDVLIYIFLSGNCNIFPTGDSSVTIDLGNLISEELNLKVLAMQQWLYTNRFEGMIDLTVAYSSLSICYDPLLVKKQYAFENTAYAFVKNKLEDAWKQAGATSLPSGEIQYIPVCYEGIFAPDLDFLAKKKSLPPEDIIRLHTGKIYRIYMIGFLPGFSYMGDVDNQLIIPRKPKPVPVAAGSVGIAGNQTGIYPVNSPGGWQIIGRTPVKQFDPLLSAPVLLKAGDLVKFHRITQTEFENGHW